MQKMTEKDLRRHLETLSESTQDEKDELLTDLLVAVYRTKHSQDN